MEQHVDRPPRPADLGHAQQPSETSSSASTSSLAQQALGIGQRGEQQQPQPAPPPMKLPAARASTLLLPGLGRKLMALAAVRRRLRSHR